MKTLITTIAIMIALTSCNNPPQGTITQISNNDKIELHKYYYTDAGSYVFVARFKDEPKVSTTTWFERRGKRTIKCTTILIDTLK